MRRQDAPCGEQVQLVEPLKRCDNGPEQSIRENLRMNPSASQATLSTVADLLEHFEGIPAHRIRLQPPPGTAGEEDVLEVYRREKLLCELVDGVLVEKPMGYYESRLAAVLIYLLETFLDRQNLGIVVGADGMLRLARGLVRIPDVSFVSWDQLPGRQIPRDAIPDLAPDLAVEVLSESNTQREMARKVREYFTAGVRLVWIIDPKAQSVQVFSSPDDTLLVREGETLSGGEVLAGFSLVVRELFERAEHGASSARS